MNPLVVSREAAPQRDLGMIEAMVLMTMEAKE